MKHQPQTPQGNALRRLITLACLISALIRGGRASLKDIGENMEDDTDIESRIQRAKRWLNNKWTDVDAHFIPYIKPIIRALTKTGEITLAIDGSTVGDGCMCLMISIIWRGRAIPICWLVRQAPKGHFPQEMHVEIINKFNEIFEAITQEDCRIILLGDGEFDGNDLQQACLDNNWDYVLKTATNTLIADNPQMEDSSKIGQILPGQGDNHLFLPDMYVTKEGYGTVNIVYWHDKRYKKPLFLLTNLEYAPEAERLYRKRYTIETLFGDLKSRGFHIEDTKISNPKTLFNLLIVTCLAFILSILFEYDARRSPFLSKFARKDRLSDLSVFQIGFRGLKYYLKSGLNISFQFSKNFPIFLTG